MAVGMINEWLDEVITKVGRGTLSIATFNDDIMRQMSLRADSYLRKNPAGADRSLPNDVRLASLVWATGDMLRQYAGSSLGEEADADA